MNIIDLKTEISALIEAASDKVGKRLKFGKDFEILIQNKGRKVDKSLPTDKIAVYTFIYGDEFLKIGQASDNARYQSQHYGDSAPSTLAKSLIADKTFFPQLDISNVKDWLKNNTYRIDVFINKSADDHLNKITLNFIEGLLQYKYLPRYEGGK